MRNAGVLIISILLLFGGIAAALVLPHHTAQRKKSANAPRIMASSQSGYPVVLTDALGRTVTIAARPERIVSLAPNVTETLYAIGAGDRLIANTSYCAYPEEAQKLPKIGDYLNPNVEKILALRPDLIIGAKGNQIEALDRLASSNIPVMTVAPESIGDIEQAITIIGCAVGQTDRANAVAKQMELRRAAITSRFAYSPDGCRLRTLFLFSPDSLNTAGPGSHIDEMIRCAGGRNIATDTKNPWPELSMESIVTADPEVILVAMRPGAENQDTCTVLERFRTDARWANVSAVKNGRVMFVEDDEMMVPGPRMIKGLEAITRALHPEMKLPKDQ